MHVFYYQHRGRRAEALRRNPPHHWGSSTVACGGFFTVIAVEVEEAPQRVGGRAVSILLNMFPEARDFLDKLASERGEDREEIVRLALGLVRIAQDAKREGNVLAIVTPALEIEQEIGGF